MDYVNKRRIEQNIKPGDNEDENIIQIIAGNAEPPILKSEIEKTIKKQQEIMDIKIILQLC